MSEKFGALMEEWKNMRGMLRMRMAMFMPGFAAMLHPNAPLMEMRMDLQELSTAPLREVMKGAFPGRVRAQ